MKNLVSVTESTDLVVVVKVSQEVIRLGTSTTTVNGVASLTDHQVGSSQFGDGVTDNAVKGRITWLF